MRYLALDFETGNASLLSACALGTSVFEDNQLVDEKISLIRPPECVGRFHWGNVRVNHIKEKMVADAPSFAEVWSRSPTSEAASRATTLCSIRMCFSCLAHYWTENARMPVLMHGKRCPSGYGLSWKIINWIRYPPRCTST